MGPKSDRHELAADDRGNVIMVPAAHTPLAPPDQAKNVIGYIRGFDVVTGKLLWTFHTVPRRGEPGYETWLNGSARTGGGNAGVWATIAADEELGLAYLPVESPYGDMYGGLRPGANLYGESIVAVDIRTGERRWHFQTSHHPLWDYDLPTAPIFVDAVKDGRTVKALAQATKQGLLFVLNRETGEPVWPIPEVAVPQGNVPGEWYSPTQPIPPTALRPSRRRRSTTSSTSRRRCARKPSASSRAPASARSTRRPCRSIRTGPISTLMVMGGSNWPGGSYDPDKQDRLRDGERRREQHDDLPLRRRLRDAARRLHGPRRGRVRRLAQHERARACRCLKPPYGTIAAFDLTKGELLWEIPNGETPDNVRNHPALQGVNARPHGPRGSTAGRARDEDAADRRPSPATGRRPTASAARCCARTTSAPAASSRRCNCRRRRAARR